MYSVVLATLLTAGSATPAWGHGCHGCGGCHGCWGGCHGCWGGCHGCWGGCYGCWGGCYGCWGGCYGCYGCGGCWGGCYGCWGGCYGYVVVPANGNNGKNKKDEGADEDETKARFKYRGDSGQANRKASPRQATVVVHLPADAKLYVDGKKANLTSKIRSFVTPELQKDQDYYYTVKAEVRRDGVTTEQSQRVFVRAGTVAHVDLNPLNPVDVVTTNLRDRASARR
jgi:uncharacterized protein (TIGR03000 family)